jgi:hypothetical protein
MLLNRGTRFQQSRDEMLFGFGRIQGQFEATLGPNLTKREIEPRANSLFLLECFLEVKSKEQ